jgi:hypothetical protein
MFRLKISFGDELFEGSDGGIAGYSNLLRHAPGGRKPRPGPQASIDDSPAQLIAQLLHQGRAPTAMQFQGLKEFSAHGRSFISGPLRLIEVDLY